MNYHEVGGYFGLELHTSTTYPHNNAIHLQSGRSAIKLIIRNHKISKIWVPYFTCKSVLDSIKEENCDTHFYSINEDLSPILHCKSNEWVIYNDYFGINSNNVSKIIKKYPNIIIDNAQSLFAKQTRICFYSPRKFIGVSDGGLLYDNIHNIPTEKDISLERAKFLFARLEMGAKKGYKSFLESEDSLNMQNPKLMSNLTKTILQSVDYNKIKLQRKKNYNYLYSALKKSIKGTLSKNQVPMVYPYLGNKQLKEKLIKNEIFIATYWNGLEEWCNKKSFEIHLKDNLLALPIDQRYDFDSMDKIINVINGGGGI